MGLRGCHSGIHSCTRLLGRESFRLQVSTSAPWRIHPQEGVRFQQRGQHANARATFTRALNMEAPNKRMNASLYYNRSACQRQLGQLKLALVDAQRAYAIDPSMLKAYWRAADVAIILDEQAEAREAIDAGLKVAPRCQPLLNLKLQIQRFD